MGAAPGQVGTCSTIVSKVSGLLSENSLACPVRLGVIRVDELIVGA